MKIAIIVENYNPSRGYAEYYLSNEYAMLDHNVYVYCFGKSTQIKQINRHVQLFILRSRYSINGYSIPSIGDCNRLFRHLNSIRPDIIHAQPLFSPLSLLLIVLKSFFSYKIVGSLITGTMNLKRLKSRINFIVARSFIKLFNKRISTFFAFNKPLVLFLSTSFGIPRNKFREMPLGSDSTIFSLNSSVRDEKRLQLGVSDEETLLTYSGLFSPEKGIHLLLTAVSTLIHEGYAIKLLLIGGGSIQYMDYLQNLCNELNISSNVIFHPWVHRTHLPELYSASDIAVWPGLPSISIIEAASVSLPIIITKSILTKHLIEYDNGLVFSSGNLIELKSSIAKLLENRSLRVDMGRRSRKLVEDKFDWNQLTKE